MSQNSFSPNRLEIDFINDDIGGMIDLIGSLDNFSSTNPNHTRKELIPSPNIYDHSSRGHSSNLYNQSQNQNGNIIRIINQSPLTPSPLPTSPSPFAGDMAFEKDYTRDLEKEYKRISKQIGNDTDYPINSSRRDSENVTDEQNEIIIDFNDDDDEDYLKYGISSRTDEEYSNNMRKFSDNSLEEYNIMLSKQKIYTNINDEEISEGLKSERERRRIAKSYGIGIEKYMENELLKLQGKLTASIARNRETVNERGLIKKGQSNIRVETRGNNLEPDIYDLYEKRGRLKLANSSRKPGTENKPSRSGARIKRNSISPTRIQTSKTDERAKSSGPTYNINKSSPQRQLPHINRNRNIKQNEEKSDQNQNNETKDSITQKKVKRAGKDSKRKSKKQVENISNPGLINTQFIKDELETDKMLEQAQKYKKNMEAFVNVDSMNKFKDQIATAGSKLVLVFIYISQPLFTKIELENIARTYSSKILILMCNYTLESNKPWIEKIAAIYNKSSSLEHMEHFCVIFIERGRLLWPHPSFRTPLLMEDEDELFGPFVNDWFVLSQRQEKNMIKIFGRNDFDMFGFMHKRGFPPPKDFIPGSSVDLLRRPQMVGFLIANASSPEIEKFFTNPLKKLYEIVKQKYHEYALEIVYIPFDKNKKLFLQSTKNFNWPLLPYEDTDIKAHICKIFNVKQLPALFLTNLNQDFHYIEVNQFPNEKEQDLLETYQIWRKILVPKIRRYQSIPFDFITNQFNSMSQSPKKRKDIVSILNSKDSLSLPNPNKSQLKQTQIQAQTQNSPKSNTSIIHEPIANTKIVTLNEENDLEIQTKTQSIGKELSPEHDPVNDILKKFPSYLSIFQKNIKLLFPNLLIARNKKTFRTFDRLRNNRVLGLLFVNPEQLTKKHQFKFIKQISKFYEDVKSLDPTGFEIIFIPYTATQREMLAFMHEYEINFLSLPFDVSAEYREVLEKMFQVFMTPKFIVMNIHIRGGAYQVGIDPSDNFTFIMKQYRHLYLKWIRDLDVQVK